MTRSFRSVTPQATWPTSSVSSSGITSEHSLIVRRGVTSSLLTTSQPSLPTWSAAHHYSRQTDGTSATSPHICVAKKLRRQGGKVIRVWQHSLKKSPDACLNRSRRSFSGWIFLLHIILLKDAKRIF
jgi:hypothetical protein